MADQGGTMKGVVDIVFLLDATGSMQTCIDQLKKNIGAFIDTLTGKDANNATPVRDWRARVIGFRDFTVDAQAWVENPFVRDPDLLKGQLAALEAGGGGDEPESLLDALYKVASMPAAPAEGPEDAAMWRARYTASRAVVVFTDATYKPAMSIPEAAGGTVEDLSNKCAENGIVICLFAPDLPIYGTITDIPRLEYFAIPVPAGTNPQQALAAFTTDQANFQETLKQLARTVSVPSPAAKA
jgi:hypothetical protein